MEQVKHWTNKLLRYCLGLFILSLGISFSIASNLGVSPVSAVPYVVSLVLEIDMGICTTVMFVMLVGLQFILLGKQFRLNNALQVFSSTIFGVFVSLANRLVGDISPGDFYPMQILCCLFGMMLVALGVMIYVRSAVLNLPTEGVMEAVCIKWHIPFHKSKIYFDCTVVITAIIISFVCLGSLVGIREGTILAAVGVGLWIRLFDKLLLKIRKLSKK